MEKQSKTEKAVVAQKQDKFYTQWWFWACAVLVVIIIAVVFSPKSNSYQQGDSKTNTTYYESNNNDNSQNNNSIDESEIKKNIKIEYVGTTKSGDFVIKITNNNIVPVYIENITTIYKDKNDVFLKKVTTDISFFGIEANAETYVYNWGYNEDFSQYAKYEFNIALSSEWIINRTVIGNYEIKANNTGKLIALELKNNNSVPVENVQVGVVFYKNNVIVGYETGYDMDGSIASGSSSYINVSYPEDKNYKDVSFDDYKIYILNADKAN